MIIPSALNVVIIGLSMVIFVFLWRMAAAAILARNPNSNAAKAMGVIFG